MFPWTGKIILLRHENNFQGSEKNLKQRGNFDFCQERPGELKSYGKNFSKKNNTW